MSERYNSFSEFYPFYLSEHSDRVCRWLHFIGTTGVIAIAVLTIFTSNLLWLLAMPVMGYSFAWVGHFFFEKNKPATFNNPFYSLIGDFVMYYHMLIGRIR